MKASGTFHVHAISEDDLGRHAPPADADSSWQESWGLAWHDPQTRTGGGRLGAGILEVRERAALPDELAPFSDDVPGAAFPGGAPKGENDDHPSKSDAA